MDFFQHQEAARRRTGLLVACYVLAVAGIVGAVYLAVLAIFGAAGSGEAAESPGLWQPVLFGWVAAGVLAVVLAGTLIRLAQLSRGGSSVALALGGRLVSPRTTVTRERRLLNVVEEMALAAGMATPAVYLLDNEEGINAFAAGFTPRDAVVGVTRGCVENLSRDELQGVIAHEFSHIVNGDMRLNLRLMGVLFGILALTFIGRALLRTAYLGDSGGRRSRDDKKGGNPLPLLGLALIAIGYIGVFFANLIKSAVSRQREFLSDASAVQFTRNPDGLAGALERIGRQGSRLAAPRASEASHLFFGDAVVRHFGGLFATHPPLRKRIARLVGERAPRMAAAAPAAAPPPLPSGLTAAGHPLVAGFVAQSAGRIDLAAGQSLLRRLPEELRAAAHDPDGARALVYALLWSSAQPAQGAQQRAVANDPAARAWLARLLPGIRTLEPGLRLPLVELAMPALKALDAENWARLRQSLTDLSEVDGRIDLFEYALRHMVRRHLEPWHGGSAATPVRHHRLAPLLPACGTLLTALAVWGAEDAAGAAAAFRAGMALLTAEPPPLLPERASLEGVDGALEQLALAAPNLKGRILEACTACVLADSRVQPEEGDLLRAIADALDVPMPPVWQVTAAQ
jgi:Zn-dependent protease with chaperone function